MLHSPEKLEPATNVVIKVYEGDNSTTEAVGNTKSLKLLYYYNIDIYGSFVHMMRLFAIAPQPA